MTVTRQGIGIPAANLFAIVIVTAGSIIDADRGLTPLIVAAQVGHTATVTL